MNYLSLGIAVLGLVFTFLLNAGGWLWFLSTLKGQVTELVGKVKAHEAVLLSLPGTYVSQKEALIERAGRAEMEAVRDARANRMEDMLHELLVRDRQ